MERAIRSVLLFVVLGALCACSTGGGSGKTKAQDAGGEDAAVPDGPRGGKACSADADCPEGTPYCAPSGYCAACLDAGHCPDGNGCFQGACISCEPGQAKCQGQAVIRCKEDGSGFELVETCPEGGTCAGGACLACYPGTKKCEGDLSMECQQDGKAWAEQADCAAIGAQCTMGVCLSPCAGDLKQNTNAGCRFYAVDLQNAVSNDHDAQNAQFAVIVSNTSKKQKAEVTLTQPDGKKLGVVLSPMSLHKFELPPTWSLDDTMVSKNAFEISSTSPIIVYQFNPLSNVVEVFSNDASVLLPVPSLGKEYRVMSYAFQDIGEDDNADLPSFFAVVGTSSNPTQVTFTVTAQTRAGGGIPALSPGGSHSLVLAQGEVLNVSAAWSTGDLTGSHIVANGPVAVFAGHECPYTGALCCCDHLEEQMVPVGTWGTRYLVSKSWERWNEKDYIRILAAEDGTTVTLDPPVASVPVLGAGQHFTFQSSKSIELVASAPILVAQYLASSYEILGMPDVLQCSSDSDCPATFSCDAIQAFCLGPTCTSNAQCGKGTTCEIIDDWIGEGYCAPIGDPAMILAVGQEQFMTSYVFLTPDAYLEDYLNVIAPLDAQNVVLDNAALPLAELAQIGSSGYGVYRTKVGDGVHTISSDKPFGIVVYGYDNDVSYGYPGGMGLAKLH